MTGAPAAPALRALVIWPPHVPSYFNAGHHLPLFTVAAHLRRSGLAAVDVVDAGALNLTWKDVADRLFQVAYDIVVVMNEYDALDGIGRVVRYTRELCPSARIVTCGRLSSQIPRFFRRFAFDAIVQSGDYEAGVAAYCASLVEGSTQPPSGVDVRIGEQWVSSGTSGELLAAQDWTLPDVHEIPYDAYDRMYRRDENKFCGIPERRELVVPVARGCPVGCSFCEVPSLQGRRERRLPVGRTLAYIDEAFAALPFEYVSFYAPTFTLKRDWVVELCERLQARAAPYPWKCVTTMHHLDAALVAQMGAAGCVRISVGLETLDPGGHDALPRMKRTGPARLEELAGWCAAAAVELNCFVILGLPGTSAEGARQTVAEVRRLGARVRPTVYAPIEQLREDMNEAEVAAMNRQLFVDEIGRDDALCLYGLLYGVEPSPTRVMERIPSVR